MSLLRNIASAFGAGQNDREAKPASGNIHRDTDYTESGGRHNPYEQYYNERGLTSHEQEVLDKWILYGVRDGAEALGMNKHTFKQIAENAREKLGYDHMNRNEVHKALVNDYDYRVSDYAVDTESCPPPGERWDEDRQEYY